MGFFYLDVGDVVGIYKGTVVLDVVHIVFAFEAVEKVIEVL